MSENPTPEAVAAIVKGLTKAQREALVSRVSAWGGQFAGKASWMDVGRPLCRAGLIAFDPNPRGSETHLTPLGLAVRQALTGESGLSKPD